MNPLQIPTGGLLCFSHVFSSGSLGWSFNASVLERFSDHAKVSNDRAVHVCVVNGQMIIYLHSV